MGEVGLKIKIAYPKKDKVVYSRFAAFGTADPLSRIAGELYKSSGEKVVDGTALPLRRLACSRENKQFVFWAVFFKHPRPDDVQPADKFIVKITATDPQGGTDSKNSEEFTMKRVAEPLVAEQKRYGFNIRYPDNGATVCTDYTADGSYDSNTLPDSAKMTLGATDYPGTIDTIGADYFATFSGLPDGDDYVLTISYQGNSQTRTGLKVRASAC